MFAVRAVVVLATVVLSGSMASGGLVLQRILDAPKMPGTNASTSARLPDTLRSNVSDCILLFGAFCNGNLGDVIQASTMSRLVKSVTSDSLCVWHAYPSKENAANGFQEGMHAFYFLGGWGDSAVEIWIIENIVLLLIHTFSVLSLQLKKLRRHKSAIDL